MKKYLLVLFCLCAVFEVFANDTVKEFQRYSYRTIFFSGSNEKKVYKYYSDVTEEDEETKRVKIIASSDENAAVIFVKTKLQKLLFLRRLDSFNSWMISNKAKRPIKVSVSQNVVNNFNVEDLTGADFENDYTIESVISDTEVMLKSLNKKAAFPYVSLRNLGEKKFLARYYSRNKKPIKEITYILGTVGKYTFWAEFTVVDLVYKNIKTVQMKTMKIETITVPKSLFYPRTMQRFFTVFK